MKTIKAEKGNTTLTPTLSSLFKVDMKKTPTGIRETPDPADITLWIYNTVPHSLTGFAFRWGTLRWINGTVCGRVSKLYKRETG